MSDLSLLSTPELHLQRNILQQKSLSIVSITVSSANDKTVQFAFIEINNILPLQIANNSSSYNTRTRGNTKQGQPSMETKQYSYLARTEKRIIKIDNRNFCIETNKIASKNTPSNSYDLLVDYAEQQITT
ncbi:hypothetical protein M0804_004302 [Polistes exclamans]|nr:hypothetical protein M0804_004302 [Polistes exclamans]